MLTYHHIYIHTYIQDDDRSQSSSRRDSQIEMRRQSMRHVEQPGGDNTLKVRKPSKGGDRKTSLAELIPDWPVLSQRKTRAKVHKKKIIKYYSNSLK